MNKSDIFTKNFTGTIDDLLKHVNEHADFVQNVLEQKEDALLDDEQAINLIKSEFKGITDTDAKQMLTEIKQEMLDKIIDDLLDKGFLTQVGTSPDGEPIYGTTKSGSDLVKKIKNPNQ